MPKNWALAYLGAQVPSSEFIQAFIHHRYLRTGVVEDLDVGREGLVHDLCCYVGGVGQVPEKSQHLGQF